MNSKLIGSLVILLSLVLSIVGYSVPSFIQKCHFGDEECLIKTSNTILTKYKDGIPEMGIMSIDPYFVNYLEMYNLGQHGPITLNITMVKPIVFGCGDPIGVIKGMKGFVKDVNNTVIEIELFIPKLTIKGKFRSDGKVLMLPIVATGDGEFSFLNYKVNGRFNVYTYKKNGKDYLNCASAEIDGRPEGVVMNPRIILGASKMLEQVVQGIIKDNPLDIYDVYKASVDRTVMKNILEMFNYFFSKHPYANLFLADE